LFEEFVAEGGIKKDDPRIAAGAPTRAAFDLLVDLGLVTVENATKSYVAVDPSMIQSRVVSPIGQEGARLLDESSQWARAFGPLSHVWRRSPEHGPSGPFTYVRLEAINPFIAGLVAECEEEMLTAQPQTGRGTKSVAQAATRDIALLERGAHIRTLYQHSARRNTVTHQYVAEVTARGAEVRTLDEFFNRIIVLDRRIAIIPADENNQSAMVIREASIVAYLVDIFERHWERARPFTNREMSMMKDIAAEQRAMTIRMLIEGHADPGSAKRLGVSPRTYAGYVADLKAEYEAETRFQLGYTMGQRGITGTESHGDDSE
ncbi:MAG: LuxR family transcriptional regulator, partial [Nocardioides sp.]